MRTTALLRRLVIASMETKIVAIKRLIDPKSGATDGERRAAREALRRLGVVYDEDNNISDGRKDYASILKKYGFQKTYANSNLWHYRYDMRGEIMFSVIGEQWEISSKRYKASGWLTDNLEAQIKKARDANR